MVNHIWTLLRNLSAANDGRPGDMLVSDSYVPVSLTGDLLGVRRVLFGADPDVEMINYRSHQMLSCIMNSQLRDHLFKYGKANTYENRPLDFTERNRYSPTVTKLSGTGSFRVFGDPTTPDDTGRMRYSLNVSSNGTDGQVTDVKGAVTTVLGLVAGTAYPLGGSGYKYVFDNPGIVQAWHVEGLLAPRRSLGTLIANMEASGENLYLALFGTERVEPYLTYRNAYSNAKETIVRMAALALALATRTEELRVSHA